MAGKTNYQVVMPKLGLTMVSASVVEWKKPDGAWVDKGEQLFSLESDKSILEIEAPASGYVEILVETGRTVPVHTPIAIIHEEAGAVQSEGLNLSPEQTVMDGTELPTRTNNEGVSVIQRNGKTVKASPKARKIARQRCIQLDGIVGSGLRGMVVAADLPVDTSDEKQNVRATPLARRMAAKEGIDLNGITGSGPKGVINRADVERSLEQSNSATMVPPSNGPTELPLSGLRKVIADRLVSGWNERPQVTLTSEIDANDLVSARRQILDETGQKISYNAFLAKAAAIALKDMPLLNSQLGENGRIEMPDVNIGIAVDTDRGLLVPVIRQAARKNLQQLQREISELGQAAIEGSIKPDSLTGGTFSITNLGAYGIDAFTPIINPPETAILGVGRIAPRPFVIDNQLVVRNTVTLSLSFDHRLVDGAPAARFLQRISQLLQRLCILSSDMNLE